MIVPLPLLLAVVAVALLNLSLAWLLLRSHAWGRPIQVPSLASLPPQRMTSVGLFRDRIQDCAWSTAPDPRDRCLGALAWLRDSVHRVEPFCSEDPVRLLHAVEQGHGLLCDGMALLFQQILAAVGIPSRILWLFRNLFDPLDSHVTVEVWLNDRWVLVDPTFGLCFTDNQGCWVSAQTLKQALFLGQFQDYSPVSLAEGCYPPRLNSYYLHMAVCFNNVFVPVKPRYRWLAKCPLLAYWLGNRFLYERLPKESVRHLRFWRYLGGLVMVILPLLVGAGCVSLLL